MNTFDTHPLIATNVSPLTSNEPSTAIVVTLLLAIVTTQFLRIVGSSIGGRSTLHVDEEEEYDVLKSTSAGSGAARSDGEGESDDAAGGGGLGGRFGDTVSLVGPCGSGKTVLFHSLCLPGGGGNASVANPQGGQNVITVTSMKATAGLVVASPSAENATSNNDDEAKLAVRLIDYPGHPSLRPKLDAVIEASARVVLTLDSTRPVADGAVMLHSILTNVNIASSWRKAAAGGGFGGDGKVPILVACTKSDVPKSKNWRRMKIQLRTELERLEKVGDVTGGSSMAPGGGGDDMVRDNDDRLSLLDNAKKGKAGGLDLDDLGEDIPALIHFLSIGGADGLDALQKFIQDGTVPSTGK